jgi:hypothetical protein
MGFSGVWVVWSLLGAPGEKKRENQMYLLVQNYLAKFSKEMQTKKKKKIKNQRFSQKSALYVFFFCKNPEISVISQKFCIF